MGNLRLFLVVAVLCAVFGDALSQNRGSSRYVARGGDDSEDESTRSQPPPPPPRSTSVRRRRPTSTTEPPSSADTQPQSPEGTTGRRVPSRTRFGSQVTSISHPVEEPPASPLPEVTYDSPSILSSTVEDQTQVRRRKPKKRRRPQGAKIDEKKDIESPDSRKEGIEPVNAEPEPIRPYHGDSELRNDQNLYGSPGLTDPLKLSHENYGADAENTGRRNTQYFPPQTGTNRLPVEKAEEIDSSRKFSESPIPARNLGGTSNRRYIPSEPTSNRGSYVPVLPPNRVPTEEQHSRSRDEVRTQQTSNPHQQRRTSGNRSPVPDFEDVSDAKSHQTVNQRNSQPSVPRRSHSEVRLPHPEKPLVPIEYDRSFNNQPEFSSLERLHGELGESEKLPEGNLRTKPQATNRLPNAPEDPYKYTFPYPENLDNEQVSHSSLPHSREESESHFPSDAIIPYSNVIPKDNVESSKSAGDLDADKHQIPRYEPPLQRSGASSQSRRPVEDKAVEALTRNHDSSRSRSQSRTETLTRTRGPTGNKQEITTETPIRQRGVSRYQPELLVNPAIGEPGSKSYTLDSLTRTSGVTRNQPELLVNPAIGEPGSKSYTLDSLTRTSGVTRNQPPTPDNQPTRTRGSTRYQSNTSNSQPTRGRSPARNEVDPSVDQTTRTRGSTRSQSGASIDQTIRTRGSTRNQAGTSADQPTRNRVSSGYTTDASLDAISRTSGLSRNQPEVSLDTTTRTRSPTRRQPDSSSDASTATRGSHRYQPDSSIDRPTRTRSSQAEVPSSSRSRNALNHPAEAEDDLGSSTRRHPIYPEVHSDAVRPQTYSQIEPEQREPHVEDDPTLFSAYSYPTSKPDKRDATDPVKNTLRSRPQYELRQPEQPSYLYEDPSDKEEDPNAYVSEYQPPPPQEVRNQRIPQSPREQPRQQSNTDQRSIPRQQQNDYRSPQPPTRRQPQGQYQEPQNDRSQTRQPSRQQTRPRQETAASTTNHGRSSGASKFSCPEAYGFFADPKQCDKYYECRNGTATDSLCEDGLAFNVASAPKFLRCDSLRDVDCTLRPELQEPRPSKNCPRRYGLYPNQEDCTKFFNCVDGIATEVQCPPGLTFNDDRATCDWADLVKSSCKTEDLLGFTCPDPSAYDLQDGVYTSYPHPDNCQLHFVCIKGEDGERRPRMLACNEGLVYNPESSACTRPDDVPGCEDFYGSLSPAPKRKPSREPLPAEPEPADVQEPQPIRRRVVQQNRRTRN